MRDHLLGEASKRQRRAAMARSVACAALLPAAAWAHDYPTVERVVYVQACMRDHPGAYYEMVNKCSCVIDRIAQDVPFDDYVTMNTATNANSIGGERGSYIRDVDALQQQIRKFRALQTQALKSCLVNLESPR
ncbi:MAG TPA: hypothetical protein VFU71_21185 [Burkholderiaceae bacterium]|nr:hypothetical protein [Burkholderiaceae bacterium]